MFLGLQEATADEEAVEAPEADVPTEPREESAAQDSDITSSEDRDTNSAGPLDLTSAKNQ